MTRKEAIQIIDSSEYFWLRPTEKEREALCMAVNSLKVDEKYELDYEDAKAAAGYWIIKTDCEGKTRTCICGNCNYSTGKTTWENPNFCENCGADMREFNKISKESGWD